METSSDHNPYAPPRATAPVVDDTSTALPIQRGRWIAGVVVGEALLTATVVTRLRREEYLLIGTICLHVAAIVFSSRRGTRLATHLLAQILNLSIWSTMAVALYILTLTILPGRSFTWRHLGNIAVIGTGGAVVSLALVLFSRSLWKRDAPTHPLNKGPG